MAWTERKKRNSERIPERTRRKVLKDYPLCWLSLPGICIGTSTQVHHVVDDADGGTDDPENLVGVCKPCHTKHSSQVSQAKAVEAAWDWKRRPEKHPGILD